MKTKDLAIILTLVLLLSCCPLWAAAEPETSDPAPVAAETGGFGTLTFLDAPGCATVITDLGGAEYTYPGCLDVSTLEENPCCERIAAYRIELNGETLLEVTLHDISAEGGVSLQGSDGRPMSNGYYAVQFDLDSKQEVFLTGLTPENLDEIQRELLAAGLAGQDVSLENIDFIDTEKHLEVENLNHKTDSDEELCWAGATSNVLHYTGWGQQAGFGSTDYLFDMFTTRFGDDGSNAYFGIPWFFNGFYVPQEWGPGWAPLDDGSYGTFRGYFPQYPVETVLRSLSLENDREKLAQAAEALRAGCGATLGVTWYTKDRKDGGHAITLWGYVRDKNDPDGFSYLVISDSDNHKMEQVDNRRSAPNTLQACGLTISTLLGGESWAFSSYGVKGPDDTTILDEIILLAPYSEDLPEETEGTGNRFTDPDLEVEYLGVDTCKDSRLCSRTVLPAGQELFFQFKAINYSEKTAEPFVYRVQVEKDGVPQGTAVTGSFDEALPPLYEKWVSDSIGRLEAGEYTITCTINPEKRFSEANYLNNTKTISFTVVKAAPAGALTVDLGQMGAQDDGSVGATAKLTRPGDCPADAVRYSLYTAYGNAETAKTGCTLQYSGSTFPTELFTERNIYYSHVWYRVFVKSGDPSQPWREYQSGPVAQKYRFIQSYAAEGNCENLTAMPQGSEAYAEGERTCFWFYNGSEAPGSLAFDWGLWAVGATGGEYCLAMGKGELEPTVFLYPKPNTSLIVIDPKTGAAAGETLPPDRYELYAVAEYEDLTYKNETFVAYLGTITITPAGELPRLTTGDASAVMHTRATFSASAWVEPGTKARLGIECSTDENFDCAALFWFTEDCRDSQMLSESRECRPLLPETTYYYRAVLEVQEGDSVKVYRDENVKSLETERPGVLKELTAEQPVSFTPDANVWSYYVFKAPESGWYNVSVSCASSYALDCFVEGDNTWYADKNGGYMYDRDGKAAFNCYIPAGRQMCASILLLDEADCTVTVSRLESSVTEYAVDAPALTSGDGGFRASVSAAVPLGSSFTLGVEYGLNAADLTTASKDFAGWREDSAQADLTLDCLPGRTYLYRAFIRDADTDDTVYSAFQTVEVPPFSGALLQEGHRTLTLERNETRSYYSFTADTAGTYTFRIDGPDGVLTYWDEGWVSKQFSLNGTYDGTAVTETLAAGETAYFTVKAYSPGEYHLSYSFAAASPSNSGSGGGGAAPAVNPVTVPSASSAAAAHGSVTASAANAKAGDTVILTPEPEEGYVTAGVTVTDAKGNVVPVTQNADGTYSFTMPATAVTITPEFVELPDPAPTGDVADRFRDVSKTAWYHDAVQWAVDKGLMNGTGDTTFAPNETCTRAMVVTMLWRLAGEPAANDTMSYTDVPEDTWYTEAVRWAASAGAVNGTADTTFDPNAPVTREQLAAILYRYAQAQGKGFTGSWAFPLDYPDADQVSEYANEAMHWMTMHGVITGMDDGTLAPKDNATRAQIATMFMRFCEELNQ